MIRNEGAEVTRFAPSPTGYMHIGGLYAALISSRPARQNGGIFYLRVEDTDKKREVEGGFFKGTVGDFCSIIRAAVTGRENSPDLYSILQILGDDEVKRRLDGALLK